jgi:hypothetical protein
MSSFLKTLNQLYLSWFSNTKSETSQSLCYAGSEDQIALMIELLPNLDLDIKLFRPDVSQYNDHEIIDLAERCATFLLYFNSKTIKHKILLYLEQEYKKVHNLNEKLLIDNIIGFYEILHKELDKAYSSSGPLIRPSSVFSSQGH